MKEPGEARRASLERNAENKARLALASETFKVILKGDGGAAAAVVEEDAPVTTSGGTQLFEDAAEFGLSFTQRPFVYTGVHINVEDLADYLGLGDEDLLPEPITVTPFVSAWDQDDNNFYIGAWCGVMVDVGNNVLPGPETEFEFEVDFTFSAIAIKAVDPEVRL